MTRREDERRRLRARAVAGRCVPVARSLPSDCLTPVLLFRRLRAEGREAFLLESVEGGESIARYTFLGASPSARFTVRDGRAFVERGGVEPRMRRGSARRARPPGPPRGLRSRPRAAAARLRRRGLPLLRRGAAVRAHSGPARARHAHARRALPEVRRRRRLRPSAPAPPPPDRARPGRRRRSRRDAEVDAAIERLDALEALLFPETAPANRRRAASLAAAEPPFVPETPRERFLDNVAAAREAIAEGEIYQVVLSQRWTARLDVDPFDVYRALRALNPSPYLFYLETREASVLGSSPEMLVRCRGRDVETRPIAGTTRRGADAAEDERLAAALAADPKERAEHVMLVDLARNDLGPDLRDRQRGGRAIRAGREVLPRPAPRLGGPRAARRRPHRRRRARRRASRPGR